MLRVGRRRRVLDGEVDELDAVVGFDPCRGLPGELGEVVEDAGLVDDEVGNSLTPVSSSLGRPVRMMCPGLSGSGFQNAISVMW